MPLPSEPITLTVEQIADLNGKVSAMRHDINNHLSLIIAAVELIRYKPHTAEKMMATLVEQPPKIAETLARFSTDLERALSITRP
jgi:SRSO17 transposase